MTWLRANQSVKLCTLESVGLFFNVISYLFLRSIISRIQYLVRILPKPVDLSFASEISVEDSNLSAPYSNPVQSVR
jgi:hypothetical protein